MRPVQIGALVPPRPSRAEAGRHLLAELELAAADVNATGRIGGRPLHLVVRDTAAHPQRAAAAVDELAALGVAALAGEYHSVVARAAASRGRRPRPAVPLLGEDWPNVVVDGTRGRIRFTRTPGISAWRWAWPPIQVVDLDQVRVLA